MREKVVDDTVEIAEFLRDSLMASPPGGGAMPILASLRMAETEEAGERVVLGHRCKVLRILSPFKGEMCQARIDGQDVVLESRFGEPGAQIVRRVVQLDTDACVPLSTFDPPPDVEWLDDDWDGDLDAAMEDN